MGVVWGGLGRLPRADSAGIATWWKRFDFYFGKMTVNSVLIGSCLVGGKRGRSLEMTVSWMERRRLIEERKEVESKDFSDWLQEE